MAKTPTTSKWQLCGDGIEVVSNPNAEKIQRMKAAVKQPSANKGKGKK